MVQLETCLCTILAERQEGDLPPECLGDIQILSVQLFAIELRYAYDMLYDLVFSTCSATVRNGGSPLSSLEPNGNLPLSAVTVCVTVCALQSIALQ